MTDTLLTDFTLSLAQSGIERDTLLYDLTDAETVALLTPLLDKARAAGAAEMQERCAVQVDIAAAEFSAMSLNFIPKIKQAVTEYLTVIAAQIRSLT